jgi:1,4-dihydroxy-2-naphthoate octaprenyltransferase
LVIHLFVYPASNGYNSYFDKDEKSIGGLKNPPPVSKGMYITTMALEFCAIVLPLKISILYSSMVFIYGLASKAYSQPSDRLKKYPIDGRIITGFIQGLFNFLY